MCAVSLASLVPAVWSPAGAVVAVCARPFTESCSTWHPLLPSLVGMEALPRTSWEGLWVVWGCMGDSLVKMIVVV